MLNLRYYILFVEMNIIVKLQKVGVLSIFVSLTMIYIEGTVSMIVDIIKFVI